jgi:hypothetical protein
MECFLAAVLLVQVVTVGAPGLALLPAVTKCQETPRGPADKLFSFAAIRNVELDAALPGTEKEHRQLTERLESWAKFRLPGPSARCTLHVALPAPRSVGLGCRNADGDYIGTLRATSVRGLWNAFRDYCLVGSSAALGSRPLT